MKLTLINHRKTVVPVYSLSSQVFLCVSGFSVCRQPTAPSQQINSNKLTSHRLLPDKKTKQNGLFTGRIQDAGTWKTRREVFFHSGTVGTLPHVPTWELTTSMTTARHHWEEKQEPL